MKRFLIVVMIFAIIIVSAGCADDTVIHKNAKQEIVVACAKDETETYASIIQDFNSNSETTRVKLLEFSKESVELHRIISSMLSGQEIQLDAMIIEDVWVGEFLSHEYLLPICGIHEFDLSSFPKGIEAFVGDKENVYWYPIMLDMGIMYWREDMADGPLSISELASGNNGSYTMQGADGEEMLCCALEFINLTDSVRDGLTLYKQAIENSIVETDNHINDFKNSKAIYMRAWSSDSRDVLGGFSPVSGLVGTDVMKLPDGSGYATSRAYGFAVNHATKNEKNCKELLEYIKSDQVQQQLIKGTGTLPIKREYYKNPVILDFADYIESTEMMFDSLVFRPARMNYTIYSRRAREAVYHYITGSGSLDDASKALESLLDTKQNNLTT